uniref:Large ribosomal subunit protein mL37 n=1 Tax=Molossus molossus TaxID=27622 RepID=A0A7J8FAB6_MOLMO|nr:mitochondrial ribosomal protein L37 [Molossus molossus]
MALASGPARRALARPGRVGLGGCGTPRREAYEWGVRSTRKPEPPPLDRVYEIPGLEPITYAGKMHFMPGLARPVFPPWDRGWTHPKFRRMPPIHEHPLYKDQVCHTFHQRCRLLEGVKQALWLTKAKLIEGLPEKVLSLLDDPRNHIENQDERVRNVIYDARLWHSTEDIPKRQTYCPVIVNSLIQLCRSQILKQPVVVQSVGTDGRVFQFLVLQLNTTDLASSEGIKNLVWVDSDQLLYQHFWCLPVIKKKVVVEPVGPTGFQPETFKKFLALYLHGAV